MSEMVERLAKKRADWEPHPEIVEDEARWWLNAITDELEATGVEGNSPHACLRLASRWLRSQAKAE